jgi:ABC-type branched-subunit amino acid transport system permease subunit
MEQIGTGLVICLGAAGLVTFALYVALYSRAGNILEALRDIRKILRESVPSGKEK